MLRTLMLGAAAGLVAVSWAGPVLAYDRGIPYGYAPHPYAAAPGYYTPYARPYVPYVPYIPEQPPLYEHFEADPYQPDNFVPDRVLPARPRPAARAPVRQRPVRPAAAVVRPAPKPPVQQAAQPALPSPFEAAGRDALPDNAPSRAAASGIAAPELPSPRPEPALPRFIPLVP